MPNRKYYVVGDGVFVKSSLNEPKWYGYLLREAAAITPIRFATRV
jgi:hypothetical protein